MQQFEQRNGPSIRKAIALLESAVATDHGYAAAWGSLAHFCATAPEYVIELTPKEWAAKVRYAAEQALRIDPDHADAQSALGWLALATDRNVLQARRLLLGAIAVDPNHLACHRRLGPLYMVLKEFEGPRQARGEEVDEPENRGSR